jgi:hypothetical protein
MISVESDLGRNPFSSSGKVADEMVHGAKRTYPATEESPQYYSESNSYQSPEEALV